MPVLLVVAIGLWLSNKRLADFRAEMRRGFEALEKKLIEDRLNIR
jgi:hypothetical protein